MTPTLLPLRRLAALAAAFAVAVPTLGAPHRHGDAELEVTLDGQQLTVRLDAPLDSLLGFERAPRTAAERQAAAALLARLKGAPPLVRPDAAADCGAAEVTVSAEVLTAANPKPGEHADLEAGFVFTCRQAAKLGALEVGFFDAFPRLRRLDVRWALPQGQGQRSLARGQKLLKLTR